MTLEDFKKLNLPDGPGVYFFKKARIAEQQNSTLVAGTSSSNQTPETLYIGKATSLRERVRSYFNDDLIKTRGRLLIDMVAQADSFDFKETDSVLEAFILESELIKQYQPRYNTKEKDNKSFNYVVITKEDFPRVLVVRGRDLEKAGKGAREQIEALGFEYTDVFGPFPFGAELKEAMKLIRRIFPFRDKCESFIREPFKFKPNSRDASNSLRGVQISSDGSKITNTNAHIKGKPCFNRTIGLCPGVCTGEISQEEYTVQISHIRNFFKGKKQAVVDNLKRQMFELAKEQKFEEANEVKKTINALAHIHDISMIKKDAEFGYVGSRKNTNTAGNSTTGQTKEFTIRAEAYDIAHMSGKDMIGVMVVMHDGDFVKDQYKKFNIREIKASNDTGALKQVLERRLAHTDWPLPTHIVLDGGIAQLNVAEEVLKNFSNKDFIKTNANINADDISYRAQSIASITLVAVTKDDKHKAKRILRSFKFAGLKNVTNNTAGEDVSADLVINTNTYTVFDDGDIVSLNQECHRFAIATHRKRRSLSRGL